MVYLRATNKATHGTGKAKRAVRCPDSPESSDASDMGLSEYLSVLGALYGSTPPNEHDLTR